MFSIVAKLLTKVHGTLQLWKTAIYNITDTVFDPEGVCVQLKLPKYGKRHIQYSRQYKIGPTVKLDANAKKN